MEKPSPITEEDVRKIAALAKLSLSSEEISRYQSQFVKILDSIAQLSLLNIENVPPTSSVLGLKNALREDQAIPFKKPEALINNAPEKDGHFFKVPKIIE
jgi:aspartyl-tRNA(Asn)/glutamyl-tRNA(Gln) amidotransferase subunit C